MTRPGSMPGPKARYQSAVDSGGCSSDAAQLEAIQLLQSLHEDIVSRSQSGVLARLLRRKGPEPVRGLYMWGGVGRGKTMLMDMFHESLPSGYGLRLHFHRFMREVHDQLRDLQGTENPLGPVAQRFADQGRVICFDEFFVADITDAMLLGGLFEELFRREMTLVATSNVAPDDLYKDGLQRARFLPAIELIKQHTHVYHMGGDLDYRLRALEQAKIYHSPLDDAAEATLARTFDEVSYGPGQADVHLTIEGRQIMSRRCSDAVVWFDFAELCDGPRSQNDYIEIAMLFQTVLLGKVPRLTPELDSQARRFISLVDEFYDRNVKLIVSADADIPDLYQGETLKFEFQRTESRLREMQSREYLGRTHMN